MTSQRIIGLTGGVGMGKSTVSNYLAGQYHLPVLDADLYARQAVEVGSPILQQIAQRYGEDILQPDGSLDRRQLGDIVFQQPDERRWLEQQIHPYVRDRMLQDAQDLTDQPAIVMSIPLLFEANLTHLVTEIWVVMCDRSQQIQRLMERDQLSQEQATSRIQSQMPIEQKMDQADVVLDNRTDVDDLLKQIDAAIAS
ncbi:MAG: dephospho-CoA kinase [Thainema sp.]